ncbi:hypothetical protein [Nostoc sp.]|uniref:hypothetical protein n=1 Tax=Nostoc sp. TaxID=1180 RepID=UPI002FF4A984
MARLAPKILNLSDEEREQLQKLINRQNTPQQIAIRAKIILMALLSSRFHFMCELQRLKPV